MSGFKDVVGHQNIIQYIGNAVTSDSVSHAYIFNGERRSRKETSGESVCNESTVSGQG